MMNQKECPNCGTTFEGRSNRIYCSDSCKQRAFQQSLQATPEQPERKPEISRKQPTSVKNDAFLAKAEVGIARLRFANEEKLKAIEVEDKHRERQHELIRQEQEFDQQQQLANANHEADKHAWSQERKALTNRLDGLEKQLMTKPAFEEVQEPEEEDPQSEGISPWLWLAGGVLALGLLAKGQKQPPTPVNLFQSPPKQPSRPVAPQQKTV